MSQSDVNITSPPEPSPPASDPGVDLPGHSLSLDRDLFLRSLLRELAGTLQDVVGLDEASGLISVVGQRLGDQINAGYRQELAVPQLTRPQVARVLVDLKQRIEGDFHVVEQSDSRIVLENSRCPFGQKVIGRPSLCMMTSNVFGVIASENLGRAKVQLAETIAEGSTRCLVIVHLKSSPQSDAAVGREYFKT